MPMAIGWKREIMIFCKKSLESDAVRKIRTGSECLTVYYRLVIGINTQQEKDLLEIAFIIC
jgi:hypothetical protein